MGNTTSTFRPSPARVITIARTPGRESLRLNERLYELLRKLPAPLKRFALWWLQPRVMLAVGAALIALLSFSIYYYNVLSDEIDLRLRRHVFDQSARILSSGLTVKIGDRITPEQLISYLESAGYSGSPGDGSSEQGSFTVEKGAIEIRPSKFAGSQLGLEPLRVTIDGRGRVSSLAGIGGTRSSSSATLEPALLASIKEGDRSKKIPVKFSEIPDQLINAVVAAEDRRFFKHPGIDWRGIGRALWIDLRRGEIVQGGSTITQQLIKNAFLTPERSWLRKIKESAMAVILESRLSKEEIFGIYSNEVYLGHSGRFGIHGFAEGARVYFDKKLSQLTLSQFAFLAGLIHAPNRYSAHRNQIQAVERRNEVLDAMLEMEAVTAEDADKAKREPLQIKKHEISDDFGVSYFVDYAQRFAEEHFGPEAVASDASVYTTLDPSLQRPAYDAVNRYTQRIDRMRGRSKRTLHGSGVQAALVALDPHNGEVLAMVGGRSYDESQLNRATDALRQPGSTFKPFVYATAFSQRRFTPATLLPDSPRTFSYDNGRADYQPSDYGGHFSNREVTLAEALTRSLNVPAVELAQQVGVYDVAELAEACGLPRPHSYPSMALGTTEVTLLDLASAYTAFANGGTAVRAKPIKEIGSFDAATQHEVNTVSTRVFSPQAAFLITSLMSAVVDHGTGSRVRSLGFKGEAAGKTGSSRDGWFVGFTPNLLCAVWVGLDDNRDLGLTGAESALPIWVEFMKYAVEARPALGGEFRQPSGLTTAVIDPTTGLLASESCPSTARVLFISGTEPSAICNHDQPFEEVSPYEESDEALGTTPDEELSGKVSWEVCAETGLLPTAECPVKRVLLDLKDFPIGVCRPELHRKPPPPDRF